MRASARGTRRTVKGCRGGATPQGVGPLALPSLPICFEVRIHARTRHGKPTLSPLQLHMPECAALPAALVAGPNL
eukprot:82328-Chlamydomonas_euryale.AAC.1